MVKVLQHWVVFCGAVTFVIMTLSIITHGIMDLNTQHTYTHTYIYIYIYIITLSIMTHSNVDLNSQHQGSIKYTQYNDTETKGHVYSVGR